MRLPSPGLQVKKLKCEGRYLKSPLHACLTTVKNVYLFWLVWRDDVEGLWVDKLAFFNKEPTIETA